MAGSMAASAKASGDGSEEIDRVTRETIEELRGSPTASMATLLRVLEGNDVACRELWERGEQLLARLEARLTDAREGRGRGSLRASGSFFDGGGLAELLGLGGAAGGLEELDGEARQAAQQALGLRTDLQALGRSERELRSSWPQHRESLLQAKARGAPLRTAGLVARLEQALLWRQRVAATSASASIICGQLADGLEQSRQERLERRQWRALTQGLLVGLELPLAARVTAVMWLRRPPGEAEAAALGGAVALAQNLEAAELAQQRLKRCAGVVMRVEEQDSGSVQRVTTRLMQLKSELCAAAERASEAERTLADGQLERVEARLRELLRELDRVNAALAGCPDNSGDLQSWLRELLREPPS